MSTFSRTQHARLPDEPNFEGPVNLAAPNPLPNLEFMRDLRQAWGARFGLPATRWMLEIAAFFMRTESELVLKSRRVVPRRLLESGFDEEGPDSLAHHRVVVAYEGAKGGHTGGSVKGARDLSESRRG